jgi:hypothetical protein
MRTEIFTTGYPKSGSTWLDRLLCELLQAPLQNLPTEPMTHYTKDAGKYVVRKLHMPWDAKMPSYHCYTDETRERIKKGKLIFIYRDPRAVVCSATHYRNQDLDKDLMGTIKQTCSDYADGSMTQFEAWNNSYHNTKRADIITTYENLHTHWAPTLWEIGKRLGENWDRFGDNTWIEQCYRKVHFKNLQKENKFFFWQGKVDGWKQYFKREHGRVITHYLGAYMMRHGYIRDMEWYKELPE